MKHKAIEYADHVIAGNLIARENRKHIFPLLFRANKYGVTDQDCSVTKAHISQVLFFYKVHKRKKRKKDEANYHSNMHGQ